MNDDLPYLPMDNPNQVDDFYKIIQQMVKKEVKNLNYNRSVVAEVTSSPIGGAGGTCDIKLLSEGNTITGVTIRSGLTVINGDFVYVTFINNQSSSFFIDDKKH